MLPNDRDFPEFIERMTNYTPYPMKLWEVEASFSEREWHAFMISSWTRSLYFSAVYVSLVFIGQYYMKDRPRFELRIPLALWSSALAIFSIMGVVRCLPEFLNVLIKHGFEESVCNPSYTYLSERVTPFWSYLFMVSKLYEFGDTMFIVLRKQPLIFLHWYHHITVMCYSWWSFTDFTAVARWFMVMNYAVHSMMYSYYALRAMRFRLPKWVSILITSFQILQMIMGIILIAASYIFKSAGRPCHQTYKNMLFGMAMYASYFILFSHFFYKSYLKPKTNKGSNIDQNANRVNGGISSKNGVTNGTVKKSQ